MKHATKGILIFVFLVLIVFSLSVTLLHKKTPKELPPKEPKEQTDIILETLKGMTLEEKIGQMFMVSFQGTSPGEDIKEMITDYKIGGVILFEKNIDNMRQLKHLTQQIQEINPSKVKLFIAIDEEGGRVSRLPDDVADFPALRAIGSTKDPDTAYKIGSNMGKLLKEAGINVNFAPVLDVNNNPDNPVIGDRSFGSDPELVAQMGISMMKGIQEHVISCVKHFPGHGDTTIDSHDALPVVKHDIKHLENIEFYPFKEAVKHGVDMIMTAHIKFPAVDASGYPATLSEKILTDLLRSQWGYKGIVISDSMTMGAITKNFTLEQSVIQGIKAGLDIILLPGQPKEAVNLVRQAVTKGVIKEDRIDESVYRILKLKHKYNLIR